MKPELHPVSLEHQADPHSGTKPRPSAVPSWAYPSHRNSLTISRCALKPALPSAIVQEDVVPMGGHCHE